MQLLFSYIIVFLPNTVNIFLKRKMAESLKRRLIAVASGGKDLTACFASLAGCLLRRPLCLRSSLRTARTARCPKCHRHFGLPLAPSQVQVLLVHIQTKKTAPFRCCFLRLVAGKGLDRLLRFARRLSPPPPLLSSSLRAARTARCPKCHRHFGLPLAPSQVQVLIS